MRSGRAVPSDTTFETHILATCMVLPVVPLVAGAIALAANATILGLVLVGVGSLLTGLFADSVLRIGDGTLEVRMVAFRGTTLRLDEIDHVYAEMTAENLWQTPAIKVIDGAGRRASICLGWWQREDEVLGRLEAAVLAAGARADDRSRQILRHKPPGAYWSRKYTRVHRTTPKPYAVRPIDYAVARVGWASIVLGVGLVLITQITRPGLGSFRVVPEAIVAFAAIDLGVIALMMARPPVSLGRMGRTAVWLTLAIAVLVTAGAVVTALDTVGSPGSPERRAAELIVDLGKGVTIAILVAVFVQLALAGMWFVWRSLVAAWGDRWVR